MSDSEPELIYVFLPESIGPMDRGDKYEDPIIDELGSSASVKSAARGRRWAKSSLTGRATSRSAGLTSTRATCAPPERRCAQSCQLGCPKGTQLHYDMSGRELQDEYNGEDWALEQERA